MSPGAGGALVRSEGGVQVGLPGISSSGKPREGRFGGSDAVNPPLVPASDGAEDSMLARSALHRPWGSRLGSLVLSRLDADLVLAIAACFLPPLVAAGCLD